MSDAFAATKDTVAPTIVSVVAATGATTGTVTFSEAVHGGTAAVPAALVFGNFVYNNVNALGATALVAPVTTTGVTVSTATVTFSAATIASDFTAGTPDTLAAAAGAIFDAAGNAMGVGAVGLTH
jgi:hypothetical protein